MLNTYCKDCPARYPACHDYCQKFAAWRKEYVKETAYNRKMMVSGSVYHRDHEDRRRRGSTRPDNISFRSII